MSQPLIAIIGSIDSSRDDLELELRYRDISETHNISTDNKDFINKQLEYLEQVKQAFLGDDELDDFAVEMHAYESY